MKLQLEISKLTLIVISGLFLSAGLTEAQQARRATKVSASVPAKQNILRVKKFSGLSNQNSVKTPEYKTNINHGRTPAKSWYRLAVNYDTAPDWIDELTFQYYAMTLDVKKGVKSYSVFKTSVRYADIEAGNKHISVAYLHPKATERYGKVVAVAFEIINNGAVIAEDSVGKGAGITKNWHKNPAIMESKAVTVRDGYLLPKADTPFAFVNVDDYEFAK